MKKINKKALKAKADKIFSFTIRNRDICQLRGLDSIKCTNTLQCMHIISRSNHRLRWDEKNALCGCSGHHMFYTSHPWEFVEVIKSNFPQIYEYVNSKRNELWDKDIQKVIDDLIGGENI